MHTHTQKIIFDGIPHPLGISQRNSFLVSRRTKSVRTPQIRNDVRLGRPLHRNKLKKIKLFRVPEEVSRTQSFSPNPIAKNPRKSVEYNWKS